MLKKPAAASAFSLGFGALAKGVGFFLIPIFTRSLSDTEYGLYALFVGYLGIATALCTMEFCRGSIYRGLQKFRDGSAFLSSAFSLIFLFWLTAGGLFLAFGQKFSAVRALPRSFWLCLFVSVICDAATNLYAARSRYFYQNAYPAAVTLLSGIFAPAAALLLLFRSGLGGEARIYGATAASVLSAIPAFFAIFRAAIGRHALVKKDEARFLIKNALPLLPHYASMMLLSGGAPILIGRFCTQGDVGRFSVAFSCGMGLSLVGSALLSSLSPWILRKTAQKKDSAVREVLLSVCDLYLPVLALFCAAAPEVFSFLAGAGYRDALFAVYPITLSLFPSFFGSLLFGASLYYEKPLVTCVSGVASAAFFALSSAVILSRFGYLSEGVLFLLSYILFALLSYAVHRRLSGADAVPILPIALRFFSCCAVAFACYLFREVLSARILLAIGAAVWLAPSARSSLHLLSERPVKARA